MERFAIKVDTKLRVHLYNICRLCGIDNPGKIKIVEEEDDDVVIISDNDFEEPNLCKKIYEIVGLQVNYYSLIYSKCYINRIDEIITNNKIE